MSVTIFFLTTENTGPTPLKRLGWFAKTPYAVCGEEEEEGGE